MKPKYRWGKDVKKTEENSCFSSVLEKLHVIRPLPVLNLLPPWASRAESPGPERPGLSSLLVFI